MAAPLKGVFEALSRNQRPRLICVGDLMLDRYVYGSVSRISPEAPIPVLKYGHEIAMPGATANVARNAAALGAHVQLVGLAGDDRESEELRDALGTEDHIDASIVPVGGAGTIVKTRYVAGGQQILRLDREGDRGDWGQGLEEIVSALRAGVDTAQAILVSDYAKGAVERSVMEALTELSARARLPVLVDPKVADWTVYGGVDVIKPNAAELAAATGLPTVTDAEIETALQTALDRFPVKAIVVTRADKGVSFAERGGSVHHHRGEPVEVFDVSGAGDTSLAALGVAIAVGANLETAVTFAAIASRIAVTKRGTAVVSKVEVAEHISRKSAPRQDGFDLASIERQVAAWREQGLKVGFTNGCFDILHVGHLKVLDEARARCDRLVLGLNSDASVKRLKGAERPVNNQTDRAKLLAGLTSVDAVVIFDEDTPLELIKALKPDLLVKGGDYSPETIVGYKQTVARGGEVHIVPLVEGRSTTATIEKLQAD